MADVGMVQRGHRTHFAIKTLVELDGGDFDRDIAAHPWIAGAVDLAHATRAKQAEDLVGSQFRAGRDRHLRTDSTPSCHRKAPRSNSALRNPAGSLRRSCLSSRAPGRS